MSPSFQRPTVTQWVENPAGGRERGPLALARAWVEVLVRPRRFFEAAVAPGDQAPGLVFAAVVVGIEEAVRFLLVADAYPVIASRPLVSALFWLLIAVVLVMPAALHLTAALQTLLLLAFVEERAGVSETVQVLAYASAPCVFVGVPSPTLRLVCCCYGAVLFVVGIATVHEVSLPTALLVAAVPALAVFGYAFRGVLAAETLWAVLARSLRASGVDVNVTVGVGRWRR